jgi:hypothetical protein
VLLTTAAVPCVIRVINLKVTTDSDSVLRTSSCHLAKSPAAGPCLGQWPGPRRYRDTGKSPSSHFQVTSPADSELESRHLLSRRCLPAGGRAGTMQRPPAINRHVAPNRMLVHSRPLNSCRDDPAACCQCSKGEAPSCCPGPSRFHSLFTSQ